uniref:BAR domain-containing protein n=1 Tax=Clastoptera arizonana TaxID=38151 RepID=A0A1B6CT49_9HEMI
MSIIRATRPENIVCEQQAKFIQDRISNVENNFAQLCSTFAAYSRKTARNVQVQRLDLRVVKELSQYDDICRHAKDEVKNIFSARERELSRQRNLERVRERNPRNRAQITTAESELVKASAEVTRNQSALQEQVDIFEKKKLHDIKLILLDFIKTELAFHSKTIELYTEAYKYISEINEQEDLEEFRAVLKMPKTMSRLETVKRTSFGGSSLQSIANLFSTPQKMQGKNISGIPMSSKSSTDDLIESLPTLDSEMSTREESDKSSTSSDSPRITFCK